MNRKDAAKFLGISVSTFRYLVARGLIRYVVDGEHGQRFYPVDELRQYVERQKQTQWERVAYPLPGFWETA